MRSSKEVLALSRAHSNPHESFIPPATDSRPLGGAHHPALGRPLPKFQRENLARWHAHTWAPAAALGITGGSAAVDGEGLAYDRGAEPADRPYTAGRGGGHGVQAAEAAWAGGWCLLPGGAVPVQDEGLVGIAGPGAAADGEVHRPGVARGGGAHVGQVVGGTEVGAAPGVGADAMFCTLALVSWQEEQALRFLRASLRHQADSPRGRPARVNAVGGYTGVPTMTRVTPAGYLRYPDIHGDLLTFVAGDDVWLASVSGGRAWQLTADGAPVSYPRFSPDGATIAWTSSRDGGPEVYLAGTDGSEPIRLTYWGDREAAVSGWTPGGEVLAVSAAGQPTQIPWAYAIRPGEAPRRLPFGPVTDLAQEGVATALVTGRFDREPASWKRYRGGTAGSIWVAAAEGQPFTRILADLPGQFASPMLIGERLAFISDHEGTGNIYSCTPDGTDLRRHTDHDGPYARNASTDGERIVYHAVGDIWLLDSLDAPAPRRLEVSLGSPSPHRAPRVVSAADHLGEFDCDRTGQASVVEVRGTIHWLTHKDGPARAVHFDLTSRARLPRVLGSTGCVVYVTTDAGAGGVAGDTLWIAGDQQASPRPVAAGQIDSVTGIAASPDGSRVALAAHDGHVRVVEVASGTVTGVAAGDDGPCDGLSWSPDSAWLVWSQPGPQPLRRIRLAHLPHPANGQPGTAVARIIDVTDGRFADTDPVFTL